MAQTTSGHDSDGPPQAEARGYNTERRLRDALRTRAQRKLKRHRLAGVAEEPAQTSPGDTGARVKLLRPSPAQPALRRYLPRPADEVERELANLGVLDWRGHDERTRTATVEEVADRIICGDAAQVLRRLPARCITCVITSPPYWNAVDYGLAGQIGPGGYEQYLDKLLEVWRECERVLQPNGKLCVNAPILPVPKAVIRDQHTRHLKNLSSDIEATILRGTSLQRYSLYIWQKQTTEKMFGSYPYPPNLYEQNTVEFINVLVKAGAPRKLPPQVKKISRLDEQQWMDLTRQVWRLYPEDVKRSGHPAPFPESLPNRLIAMYTFAAAPEHGFPGDIVLDPFCGTGATCVAARKLGRRFIGVDLSPDFAVHAAKRVAQAQQDGRIALHGKTGFATPQG